MNDVGDPVSVNDRSACDLTQPTLGGSPPPPIDILQIARDAHDEARLRVALWVHCIGTNKGAKAYNSALLHMHMAQDDLNRVRDLVWDMQDADAGGFW